MTEWNLLFDANPGWEKHPRPASTFRHFWETLLERAEPLSNQTRVPIQKSPDLSVAGWGVILPEGLDPVIRNDIKVLLERRQRLIGQKCTRLFQVLTYGTTDTPLSFLARNGFDSDKKRPFFLLIVGDGHQIPWTLQYRLQSEHAVGRIFFETPEGYWRYANAVVDAERNRGPKPSKVALLNLDAEDESCSTDALRPWLGAVSRRMRDGWKMREIKRLETAHETFRNLKYLETSSIFLSTCRTTGQTNNPEAFPGPGMRRFCNHLDLRGLIALHIHFFSSGLLTNRHKTNYSRENDAFVALGQCLLNGSGGGALSVVGFGVQDVFETGRHVALQAHIAGFLNNLTEGVPVGLSALPGARLRGLFRPFIFGDPAVRLSVTNQE